MKNFILPLATICLSACEKKPLESPPAKEAEVAAIIHEKPAPAHISNSVVRINTTSQSWNPSQPWEKRAATSIRALGAIVGENQILTSAEIVADATYLELQTTDGKKTSEAKIIARDYEANLALLAIKNDAEVEGFFEGTDSLAIADSPKIGDTIEVVQVEMNGTTLLTQGRLQSVEVASSFLPGHRFLTYLIKASLQSAANSYSLPAVINQKLAGVLVSYDSEDQISDVISIDVVSRFLQEFADGEYSGFPRLGITTTWTDDPSFRDYLKLEDQTGGLYIGKVREGSAADLAGVKEGDVLLSVEGFDIDRRGYYQHPIYETVFWSNLVRGNKAAGDEIQLKIFRQGELIDISAKLTREETSTDLVPTYQFDRAPNFLVKGGLIFQELSKPLLEAYGKKWTTRAPLNLLDVYENPEKFEEGRNRIVFLSGSIPTPATVGYESLRNHIVKNVNGTPIKDLQSLIAAFEKPNANGQHSIQFMKNNFTVYIDESVAKSVDGMLLQRGLNRLSRAE